MGPLGGIISRQVNMHVLKTKTELQQPWLHGDWYTFSKKPIVLLVGNWLFTIRWFVPNYCAAWKPFWYPKHATPLKTLGLNSLFTYCRVLYSHNLLREVVFIYFQIKVGHYATCRPDRQVDFFAHLKVPNGHLSWKIRVGFSVFFIGVNNLKFLPHVPWKQGKKPTADDCRPPIFTWNRSPCFQHRYAWMYCTGSTNIRFRCPWRKPVGAWLVFVWPCRLRWNHCFLFKKKAAG